MMIEDRLSDGIGITEIACVPEGEDRLSDGIEVKETAYESSEWPDGVVLRELVVGRRRRLPAAEYIYCNDVPTLKGAFGLPGNAGLVWLLVSHRSRVTKAGWVTLPQTMLNEWGIDKSAKSRALAALQAAGYVEVSYIQGRSAQVRLVRKAIPRSCGKVRTLPARSLGDGRQSDAGLGHAKALAIMFARARTATPGVHGLNVRTTQT